MEPKTHGHVNYTNVFMEAFRVLKESRENRQDRKNNFNYEAGHPWSKHLFGSNCAIEEPNQAVFVITDGVPNK